MTSKFVGVDGCRGGWLAIAIADDSWDIELFPSVFSLWYTHRDADRILIDIPIGLREETGTPRVCDSEARSRLSPVRHGSVFPVPCRAAVYMDTYGAARRANLDHTGKSLNSYSWGICPKIREVDELLEFDPAAKSYIRETHPEICFWSLNGYEPLATRKTTEAGRSDRTALLEQVNDQTQEILTAASSRYMTRGVRMHDVLDAYVAAVTAAASDRHLRTLPDDPELDRRGLPMEFVYATQWLVNQSSIHEFSQ